MLSFIVYIHGRDISVTMPLTTTLAQKILTTTVAGSTPQNAIVVNIKLSIGKLIELENKTRPTGNAFLYDESISHRLRHLKAH